MWRIYTENSYLMHHSQAVRHRALTSVCVGSNPTGVVKLFSALDPVGIVRLPNCFAFYRVVLLSCTLLDLFQLRVVQDHSESFTSYRGVKINLSRFFSIFPQNIIAFSLDSRYRRYMPCVRLVEGAVLKTVWM